MNIEYLSDKVEKVESIFNNILYLKPEDRIISPQANVVDDLKTILNEIFDENKCTDILFTLNTDKPFFAINVVPSMNGSDALTILTTDENIRLVNYQIEFDSKLFNIGLDSAELTALLLFEINSMMCNNEIFEKLRLLIDIKLLSNDDVIRIRESANYAQLMIFAVKDTLQKLGSVLLKDTAEELITPIIQATDLQNEIVSAKEKILASDVGLSDTLRTPVPVVLDWTLMVYSDIKNYKRMIQTTLTDAKAFTGSRLEKRELDACIDALNRLDTAILFNESVGNYLDNKNLGALNELSIFKALKKNGLRGLENELYEYKMRVKNCTSAEDAYLIMRGINSRLGILEDYLYNEDLSDHDRKHWEEVAETYRQLRVILSQKKFEDKQYGLFFDYSALDKLDKKIE